MRQKGPSLLTQILLLYLIYPASVAHCSVSVISAEHYLVPLCDDASVFVESRIYGRLASAFTYCLDLCDRIRELHQTFCTREEVSQEVSSQAKTKHRQVALIHECAESVYLRRCKKLCFVGDDDIVVISNCVILMGV